MNEENHLATRFNSSFALLSAWFVICFTAGDCRAQNAAQPVKNQAPADWTKEEYIAREKAKWKKNGWRWNLPKVEAVFREIDTDKNGLASKKERQAWYAQKAAERKKPARTVWRADVRTRGAGGSGFAGLAFVCERVLAWVRNASRGNRRAEAGTGTCS